MVTSYRQQLLKNALGLSRTRTVRPTPIVHLIMTGVLSLGIGAAGQYVAHHYKDSEIAHLASGAPSLGLEDGLKRVSATQPMQTLHAGTTALVNAAQLKPELANREIELDDGQSFSELLEQSGVSEQDSIAAENALSKVYDVRRLRAGLSVNLVMSVQGTNEKFVSASFLPEATHEVVISRNDQGRLTASQVAVPVERHRLAASGEIHSSLYEAGDRVGVPHSVMASLMHIYAHDMDFQRDLHPGDRFDLLYDQPMTPQGKPVGEGSIIYASLTIAGQAKPIFRVTFNDASSDYFDDKGHSVRRALLRTPVAVGRMTSGFGMRMHPLLGYSKMHKGIDFGAPTGTPIFAAGNGTVEEIGNKSGYGRYIRIRHNGELSTAYAHMSRYNQTLYRGIHVNQGQVIGYVGMSGRATGPHLHYEVHLRGKQVNPLSVNMPSGRVLDGKLLALFKQGQDKIRSEYAHLLTDNTQVKLIKTTSLSSNITPTQSTSCGVKGGC